MVIILDLVILLRAIAANFDQVKSPYHAIQK